MLLTVSLFAIPASATLYIDTDSYTTDAYGVLTGRLTISSGLNSQYNMWVRQGKAYTTIASAAPKISVEFDYQDYYTGNTIDYKFKPAFSTTSVSYFGITEIGYREQYVSAWGAHRVYNSSYSCMKTVYTSLIKK